VSRLDQVDPLVREHRPGYVFQLAASSTTRHEALFDNHDAISTGAWNVLESVWKHCRKARVFLPGSGVQFENRGEPISQDDPFEASSPYSVARIQSVYAARYFRSLGLRAYVGYLFHHESPRRPRNHVSQQVVRTVCRIAAGSQEILELGDLGVEKEWTYAGDVVRAMITLVDQEGVFEATIGSGVAHSIETWVRRCFELAGLDWRDHTKSPEGYRAEYPRLVSDPERIRSLGWEPTVDLPALAEMMMRAEENQRP
jgi:GDPmannose 4,6-dehydratase